MQAIKMIQTKLDEGLSSHAYLLVGDEKTLQDQLAKVCAQLKLKATDILEIRPEEKKNGEITIPIIKELKRGLSHSATGKRLAVIHQADKLNAQAANSFLKTLEEPPENTIVMLLAQTSELLPTITSRCQIYQFPTQKAEFELLDDEQIGKLLKMTIKERFDLADKVAKATQVPQYIDDLTRYYHQKFLTDASVTEIIEALLEAKTHLSANVTPRLVLENIFLTIQ
jgi:DNA polymerase-3 subunit delta'